MNSFTKMIQQVFIQDLVSEKVIDEEVHRDKICSCCNNEDSYFLLAQSRGIAVVLEHVCEPCYVAIVKLIDLEKDPIRVGILLKNKV